MSADEESLCGIEEKEGAEDMASRNCYIVLGEDGRSAPARTHMIPIVTREPETGGSEDRRALDTQRGCWVASTIDPDLAANDELQGAASHILAKIRCGATLDSEVGALPPPSRQATWASRYQVYAF
mmetsp:Transcript_49964/g.74561  ORF Transcript_49964/g.74561 Transcript_49964/m.74561 type:complete len:126 (-) Transcript_49964:686-1063(-)